jgi:hypothetical protein
MFHNFQKHIITLLKKCCRFGTSTFVDSERYPVATALWQAFIKLKSSNKRVLNIVFGFASGSRA